jgi:hypothetical protein
MRSKAHVGFISTSLIVSAAAIAGGSNVAVVVTDFQNDGGTDYTLTVDPIISSPDAFPDPYMGRCEHFTVTGTFSRLAGFQLSAPPMVTRHAHLEALAYLRKAAASHASINLGWMGTGFLVPDSAHPCAVKSRALVLFGDEHGISVVSFFHAI